MYRIIYNAHGGHFCNASTVFCRCRSVTEWRFISIYILSRQECYNTVNTLVFMHVGVRMRVLEAA